MGYCTGINRNGREVLACDGCGQAGGARRRRCPFGYCPAQVLCDDCHKREKWGRKATHQAFGCEIAHEKFQAERNRETELLTAGVPVRCAALNAGTSEQPDRVHVLFAVQDCCGVKGTIGRYMPSAIYNAHPIGVVVTLAEYEKVHEGPLPEAPEEFSFGRHKNLALHE